MANSSSNNSASKENLEVLKKLSIFKETPENILSDLAPLMKQEQHAKGETIFNEGDHGNCMYIIHSGEVRIHKGSTELAVLAANEVFGELSLLDAETRSATASAETNCIIYKIDQQPFYNLIHSRPEISLGIIRILARRLRAQNERSVLLSR